MLSDGRLMAHLKIPARILALRKFLRLLLLRLRRMTVCAWILLSVKHDTGVFALEVVH